MSDAVVDSTLARTRSSTLNITAQAGSIQVIIQTRTPNAVIRRVEPPSRMLATAVCSAAVRYTRHIGQHPHAGSSGAFAPRSPVRPGRAFARASAAIDQLPFPAADHRVQLPSKAAGSSDPAWICSEPHIRGIRRSKGDRLVACARNAADLLRQIRSVPCVCTGSLSFGSLLFNLFAFAKRFLHS